MSDLTEYLKVVRADLNYINGPSTRAQEGMELAVMDEHAPTMLRMLEDVLTHMSIIDSISEDLAVLRMIERLREVLRESMMRSDV